METGVRIFGITKVKIISTVLVVLGFLLVVCVMSAGISSAYAQTSQRLKVNLYVYSTSGKPGDVVAWVKYKGQTITKSFNYKTSTGITNAKGVKYVLAQFLFPSKPKGWVEWYDICVRNVRTWETNCGTQVWWTNPMTNYLQIFNTR